LTQAFSLVQVSAWTIKQNSLRIYLMEYLEIVHWVFGGLKLIIESYLRVELLWSEKCSNLKEPDVRWIINTAMQ